MSNTGIDRRASGIQELGVSKSDMSDFGGLFTNEPIKRNENGIFLFGLV